MQPRLLMNFVIFETSLLYRVTKCIHGNVETSLLYRVAKCIHGYVETSLLYRVAKCIHGYVETSLLYRVTECIHGNVETSLLDRVTKFIHGNGNSARTHQCLCLMQQHIVIGGVITLNDIIFKPATTHGQGEVINE